MASKKYDDLSKEELIRLLESRDRRDATRFGLVWEANEIERDKALNQDFAYSLGTYAITTPSGRTIPGPPPGNYWRYSEARLKELDRDKRIWWGKHGNNVPAIKRFLSEVQTGMVPQTLWTYSEVGHTQDAKKEIHDILEFPDSASVFSTPKPLNLIDRILRLSTGPHDLVLDFFAGSGGRLFSA